MPGKLDALAYLLSCADGPRAKATLLRALTFGEIARFLGAASAPITVKFRQFYLRFQPAQGELTPFREIADAIAGVLPEDAQQLSQWTIIDGGANIGLFSLFCKGAAQIIAVEPNPIACARLRENFRLNAISGTVVEQALSSEVSNLFLSVPANSTVLTTVSRQGDVPVPATTVDVLVEQHQLASVDLLKLDVEGFETEALAGASRSLANGVIRRVYAEYNSMNALAGLDGALGTAGFTRSLTLSYNALFERTQG